MILRWQFVLDKITSLAFNYKIHIHQQTLQYLDIQGDLLALGALGF